MKTLIRQGDPFTFNNTDYPFISKIIAQLGSDHRIDIENGICQLPPGRVGVIKMPSKTIIILPRHERVELRHVIRMYYFIGNTLHNGTPDDPDYDLETQQYSFNLTDTYAKELREVIRKGLPSNYLEKSEDLNFVKGRINPINTEFNFKMKRRNPISSIYDELTINNNLNKVLSGALWKIKDKLVAQDFTFLANNLPLCSFEESLNLIDKISFDRNTVYCRRCFDLARMILKELYFEDIGQENQGEAFLIDYNKLFEEFIRTILKDYSGDPRFSSWQEERRYAEYMEGNNFLMRSYIPDILYDFREGSMPRSYGIIDAKNKMDTLFSNPDIFQLQFYASLLDARKLILVYPYIGNKAPSRLEIKATGPPVQEVYAVYMDLSGEIGTDFALNIKKLCEDVINCLWE